MMTTAFTPSHVKTIYITRHGNREDFADPSFYEWSSRPWDPDLSADGVEMAFALGRQIKKIESSEDGEKNKIGCIYSSPFIRAVRTAFLALESTSLRSDDGTLAGQIKIESGLSEYLHKDWYNGAPALLAPTQLNQAFDDSIDATYASRVAAKYPETWVECVRRIESTLTYILRECDSETVLLVGHGAVVVALVLLLQGMAGDESEKSQDSQDWADWDKAKKMVRWDMCSLTKFTYQEATKAWNAEYISDTSFMDDNPDLKATACRENDVETGGRVNGR